MVSKNKSKLDWREFQESEMEQGIDVDDPDDQPTTKEMIEAIGFDPDELFKTKKKKSKSKNK